MKKLLKKIVDLLTDAAIEDEGPVFPSYAYDVVAPEDFIYVDVIPEEKSKPRLAMNAGGRGFAWAILVVVIIILSPPFYLALLVGATWKTDKFLPNISL